MNWNDIEIILGQDHVWWLYSNERDQYCRTGLRYRTNDENDVRKYVDENGIVEEAWQDELTD